MQRSIAAQRAGCSSGVGTSRGTTLRTAVRASVPRGRVQVRAIRQISPTQVVLSPPIRVPTSARTRPHTPHLLAHAPVYLTATLQVFAADDSSSSGPGLLQRLGRVIKEKAAGDFDRFFKGTSKTRERLGVGPRGTVVGLKPSRP